MTGFDLAKTLVDIAQRQSGATDRTERYAKRLDAHLLTLASAEARSDFLIKELANWNARYRAWAATVDAGGDDRGFTAWDFTVTIADIAKRQAKYADRVPA